MSSINYSLSITVICLSACVDPIYFNPSDAQFKVVVEGMISDQPGPYTVKLSKSLNLDADTLIREPVQNASIKLYDDEGNVEDLVENSPGIYVTGGAIHGQVGRQYHIVIVTPDGIVYQSAPDKLDPVGAVERIIPEFEARSLPTFFGAKPDDVFNIYVDGDAVSGGDNYVRWRFTGIYQVVTYPQLRQVLAEGYFYSDPPPCSGYVVEPALGGGALVKKSDCTCCICWITQPEILPTVSDGQFISNNQFKHVKVAEVPVNSITFSDKYLVELDQMSLSKTAYDFFRLIRDQSTGASSLFQPISGQINGNITSVNSNNKALGLFWATSIKSKSLFINRSEIPFLVAPPDSLREACTFYANSSVDKPSLWQ